MGRFISLFTTTLAAAGTALAGVVDLTATNFDSLITNQNKPALVELFAPWCGHCKKLAPIYDELAGKFDFAKDKVTIAKCDADEHKEIGVRFDLKGFPTLLWFDGKSDKPEVYNGGRDLDSLSDFVTEKIGVKPRGKKAAPSAVQMLSDSSWAKQIGAEKDALVAFTAPWCGHCKSLAPTWESVASAFSPESSVIIGKVDCDAEDSKATKAKYDIASFPTIKYFPKGSTEAVEYHGGRTEKDLINFINEKVGTHRAVGGGLDAIAGTIPSLDELLSGLKEGGEKAYTELEAAAGKLQGAYAEYYGKVAKKLSSNAGYVEKESARLKGLLAKGGLTRDKTDDLTTRSNILAKFKEGVEGLVGKKDEL